MALSPLEELLLAKEPALKSATSRAATALEALVLAALGIFLPIDAGLKIALLSALVALMLAVLLLSRLAASARERRRLEDELATAKNPEVLQKDTIEILRYIRGGKDFVYSDALAMCVPMDHQTLKAHLSRLADIEYIYVIHEEDRRRCHLDKRGREFLSRNGML